MEYIRTIKEHIPDILRIYKYYVKNTTVTFALKAPTVEEMEKTMLSTNPRFLSYTMMEGTKIVGYVYLAKYKERAAYDKTAEVSIYIHEEYQGKGYGQQALTFIEEQGKSKQFKVFLAVICAENTKSIKLFEKNGYFSCANLKEVGEKFGRTLDVVMYEKILDR